MPTLSRWFIKAGLIYFALGLLLGALMLAQPVLGWPAGWQALRPVYLHLLFIGWVSQIIMGVGYWMFPKYSKAQPRGSESLGWFTFAALNAGLLLRAIAEPLMSLAPQWGGGWLLLVSAILLFLASLAFIANTWGRIKER